MKYRVVEVCVYEVECDSAQEAIDALINSEDINQFFVECRDRVVEDTDEEYESP